MARNFSATSGRLFALTFNKTTTNSSPPQRPQRSVARVLQDPVAGVVPVGIINGLEMINVNEEQPKGHLVLVEFGNCRVDLHLGVCPVANAGERIEKGFFLQLVHPAPDFKEGLAITENFHRTQDAAMLAAHRRSTDEDRHTIPLRVPQMHLGLARLAVFKCGLQRTTVHA